MKTLTVYSFLLAISFVTVTGCSDKDEKSQQSYASKIQTSDIVGDWKVGGGVAKVRGSDASQLSLTTEAGMKGVGTIRGDHIEVPAWNLTGKLTSDGKHISWSNNVNWDK